MRSLSLKIHILSIALLAAPLAIQAANLVVDNNPANDAADYHDLQEAIDAAAAGDIIYVMPSMITYGDITLKSSLTLVGTGFWRPDGYGGDNAKISLVGIIYINAGVHDVFVTGIETDHRVEFGSQTESMTVSEAYISDVYFYRNRIGRSVSTAACIDNDLSGDTYLSDVYFIGNHFYSRIDLEGWHTEKTIGSVYFYNNILLASFYTADSLNTIVANNLFNLSNSSYDDVYQRSGMATNNIFYSTTFSSATAATYRNNLFINGTARGDNALSYSSMSEVLKDEGPWPEFFQPIENSPALGAGVDGADIGIFGGLHPWGNNQPPIPIITNLSGPSIVNPGQGLTLTVEAEANN